MPWSICGFIKQIAEFQPQKAAANITHNTRGIYALLDRVEANKYSVVYIGRSVGNRAGIRSRMKAHLRSKRKRGKWTHFSIYEVHDNITPEQILELEGLFRHIFRKDPQALKLNAQKRYKKFEKIRHTTL